MEMWTEIRRKILVEGASRRSILRNYKISADVLERSSPTPNPGYRQSVPRPNPRLGELQGVIDEILEADKTAPPKQRSSRLGIEAKHSRPYRRGGAVTP